MKQLANLVLLTDDVFAEYERNRMYPPEYRKESSIIKLEDVEKLMVHCEYSKAEAALTQYVLDSSFSASVTFIYLTEKCLTAIRSHHILDVLRHCQEIRVFLK